MLGHAGERYRAADGVGTCIKSLCAGARADTVAGRRRVPKPPSNGRPSQPQQATAIADSLLAVWSLDLEGADRPPRGLVPTSGRKGFLPEA